jgi:hypothetical protein
VNVLLGRIKGSARPAIYGGGEEMYVYIRTEKHLWTVGHYDPNGKWIPESDHGSKEEAAERVHYLNGSK